MTKEIESLIVLVCNVFSRSYADIALLVDRSLDRFSVFYHRRQSGLSSHLLRPLFLLSFVVIARFKYCFVCMGKNGTSLLLLLSLKLCVYSLNGLHK
jgi:hypothetical protein